MPAKRLCRVPTLLVLLAALISLALPPQPGQAQTSSDPPTHDPAIIKQGSYYYLFNTGGRLDIRRSTDLRSWSSAGTVFADSGNIWYTHHYYDSQDGGRSKLHVRPVTWSDGWPTVGAPVSGMPAGTYALVNRNSGKCLAVSGSSTADGANVQQWACTGAANQRWRIEDTGGGYSRLVNVQSGKALDVANCGTADGADVRQWGWLNNACQQWRLQP